MLWVLSKFLFLEINFKYHILSQPRNRRSLLLISLCLCTNSCHLPMSYMCLFCFEYAWSNTSIINDRSNIKPLSVRDGSVKSTCLSPLLFFDLVSLSPEAGHFLSLAGVLTPLLALSGALGRGTMLFTVQRALCAESQHSMAGWTREQPAARPLAHKHTSTVVYKHTQAHTVTWPSQGVGREVSCATITTHGGTGRQTDTDIHNPSNYNLLVVSNCYSRTWNVKLWVWWLDRANTHEGYRKFTLTGCDSIHSGELYAGLT